MKERCALLLMLMAIPGCGSPAEALGHGFELVDQGGSKRSLTRDGLVVISYTVTGVGRIAGGLVIETREHGAAACEYGVIRPDSSELLPLSRDTKSDDGGSWREAENSVQPRSQRSCRASSPGGRAG